MVILILRHDIPYDFWFKQEDNRLTAFLYISGKRKAIVESYETFEKGSILFKIKAREDFNHRNILNILRIKI